MYDELAKAVATRLKFLEVLRPLSALRCQAGSGSLGGVATSAYLWLSDSEQGDFEAVKFEV